LRLNEEDLINCYSMANQPLILSFQLYFRAPCACDECYAFGPGLASLRPCPGICCGEVARGARCANCALSLSDPLLLTLDCKNKFICIPRLAIIRAGLQRPLLQRLCFLSLGRCTTVRQHPMKGQRVYLAALSALNYKFPRLARWGRFKIASWISRSKGVFTK
jgi:hypothetical protein